MHSGNKTNPRKKPAGRFWYDLIKSIFIAIKMTRIDNALLSCIYKDYKSFLDFETDDILLATYNIIFFERLTK